MAAMFFRFALIVGFLVGSAAPDHVAAGLDSREHQLEGLYADFWTTQYEMDRGEHGLSTLPVQEKIRAVFADEGFLRQLQDAKFSDSQLETRRKLFLNEAVYTKITNDPALTKVVEQVTEQENAFRYKVGARQLTRAELTDLITHNPDRRLREEAWRAASQITAVNGPGIQQAIKLRNELAGKYSDELFSIFMLHRKGLEVQDLFTWFDQIKEQTEPEYQRLLERMRHDLKVEKIEPWDLDYYFANFTSDFEAQKFPTDEGWAKAKELASGLGYDLGPVEMHVADLGFGGAAYPIRYGKEVKILANRYSGIYFYDRLFHATGHALHYQMMDEPSFLLRANYAEPMDEGMAQLVTLMLYRPEVNTKLFGLTTEQAKVLASSYRLKMLYNVRNTIADALSEFETYGDPDQDVSAIYDRVHSQYLGVDMHGAPMWAFNPMYGGDPIYLQSFVVGEMIAHQIEYATDEDFGTNWGKEAGTKLRENFYSRGAGESIHSYMRKGTGQPLTPQYLIRFLQGTLGRPNRRSTTPSNEAR